MTLTPPTGAGAGAGVSAAAAEVRDVVREARAGERAIRIVGGGTWLDAGRPVRADARLELKALAGIVEYVPGDLTLTALAGTTLAELERATAAEGQWLPLDPFGSPVGTLGATVATASSGPLSLGLGVVRDVVLGVEVVTGRGEVVRAGGRVVKNVAGFDLARLMIGAWGTLGAITEVTVRLRARPDVDRTVAIAIREGAAGVEGLLQAVRTAPIAPAALQLVSREMARHIGAEANGSAVMLIRLCGNEEAVGSQRGVVAGLGDAIDVGQDVWRALRAVEPADAAVVRASAEAGRLGEIWHAATGAGGVLAHAWVGTGTVRLMESAQQAARLAELIGRMPRVNVIGERLPGELWSRIAPSMVDDRLSRGVREAFDPDRILNPGILGEANR
ncbi:MAG TPA: FAD-binding protein [Gemmatimonadaceae bacterium]|nr:FAD-binding protein [Gemmatimonadaceae bacterium]